MEGTHVGDLRRVLFHRADMKLYALVVGESRRFSGHFLRPGAMLLTDELLVPASAVEWANRERIELNLTATQVRALPPYLAYKHRGADAGEQLEHDLQLVGGLPIPSMEETANKAPEDLEVNEEESVMVGDTGKRLGTVKDVLLQEGELLAVVIQPAGWFKEELLLPRRLIARADDLSLFTTLSEDDLKELDPFQP